MPETLKGKLARGESSLYMLALTGLPKAGAGPQGSLEFQFSVNREPHTCDL